MPAPGCDNAGFPSAAPCMSSKQNQWIVGVNAVASAVENDAENVREVLVESGAVTPAELRELDAAGACGDVLAHFLTTDGQIAHPGIDSRTVGLGLDDVRNANCAIAVAAGPAKVPMVRAALRSGLCSVLITDEPTATAVLEQNARAGGMA